MDIKQINPSQLPPGMTEGEALGRLLAERQGVQYENLQTRPMMPPPDPAAEARMRANAAPLPEAQPEPPEDPWIDDPKHGRIELGKPARSTALLVPAIVGAEMASNTLAIMTVRALLHVRSVGGRPVAMPSTRREADILLDTLGDEAMDAITGKYLRCFLGVRVSDLPLSDNSSSPTSS